jgi:hypothetical protein
MGYKTPGLGTLAFPFCFSKYWVREFNQMVAYTAISPLFSDHGKFFDMLFIY